MRRLLPLVLGLLFASPAGAQWTSAAADEYATAVYDQAFTYSWVADGFSPTPHQDISACKIATTVTISGSNASVTVSECQRSDSGTNQCVPRVSASEPGVHSVNFAKDWVSVLVTASTGAGSVEVECQDVDNQTWNGSAWVPTYPSTAANDAVKVNTVDTTDPDFTDSSDIDFILCVTGGDPDADCGNAEEVLAKYASESIVDADISPSADIDGDKVEVSTSAERGTIQIATQSEVSTGNITTKAVTPGTLTGRIYAASGDLTGNLGSPSVKDNSHDHSSGLTGYLPLTGGIISGPLEVQGQLDLSNLVELPLGTTPSVSGGNHFFSNVAPAILTDFADGVNGQPLFILTSTTVTYDCDSVQLNCGPVDLATASGDHTLWINSGGNWTLVAFFDISQDQTLVLSDYLPLTGGTLTGPGNLSVEGSFDIGTAAELATGSLPSVDGGSNWYTPNQAPTTITDFVDEEDGQLIAVLTGPSAITYDCEPTALNCGTTDLVTANGDKTYWQNSGGIWDLIAFTRASDNNNPPSDLYLPLTGGELDGTGDLQVGGALHVTELIDVPAAEDNVTYFAAADTTPDVQNGSYFYTDGNGETITDFDWGAGDPTEFGQIIFVRTTGSGGTNFDCTTVGVTKLSCGSQDLATLSGDYTVWISLERIGGGGLPTWKLISYHKSGQAYGDFFLLENSPITIGTTRLDDTQLLGYLDLGDNEYFSEGDTDPSVQQGTVFYSFECINLYDEHCDDNFSSRANGPCVAGIQCSGTSDGKCDSDGTTSVNEYPQRVGSPDTECDADGSDAPVANPDAVTIRNFVSGVDAQVFYAITRTDEGCVDIKDDPVGAPQTGCVDLGTECPDFLCDSDGVTPAYDLKYDCTTECADANGGTNTPQDDGLGGDGLCDYNFTYEVANTPHLICGDFDIETLAGYTATWLYDGPTKRWRLMGLETFSDAVKVGLRGNNNLTGDNQFTGDTTLAGVVDYGDWVQFGSGDATPSVLGNVLFTVPTSVTITDFDDGELGQRIYVANGGFGTTIDCTGTNLICGDVDLALAINDITTWVRRAGKWYLTGVVKGGNDYDTDVASLAPLASPTFTGVVTTDDLVVEGVFDIGTAETLPVADTTPSVATGSFFTTPFSGYGVSEITDFDDATDGQIIWLVGGTGGAGFLIDCDSATEFDCGTADIRIEFKDLISFTYTASDDKWHLNHWYHGDNEQSNNFLGTSLQSSGNEINHTTSVSPIKLGTTGGNAEYLIIQGWTGTDGTVYIYSSGDTIDIADDVDITGLLDVDNGGGAFASYDATFGDQVQGGVQIGSSGIYSSVFATGNINLGKTLVFRNEATVDGILEFAWIEGGNTLRAGIPESGADNATNFFRSFMITGPYSAATGDNHFKCSQVDAHIDSDCNTSTTGPDMIVGDDLEVLGRAYIDEDLCFEGATRDANHHCMTVDDPAADVTTTLPKESGRLVVKDRKCIRVDNGRLTTGLQLPTIWSAYADVTITGIWCETDAGSVGMDFDIDDGTPAGVNGSDISCTSTGLLDETLAGDVTMAKGDRLDLDTGTVTTATRLTACFDYVED